MCSASAVRRMWMPGVLAATCACGEAAVRPAETTPSVEYGSRVQVVSARVGEDWHSGVVGRVGACLAVMVARGDDSTAFVAIPFGDVTRLRVSDARPSPSPASGGQAADVAPRPDAWTEIPAGPLRAAYGNCTPF